MRCILKSMITESANRCPGSGSSQIDDEESAGGHLIATPS